MARHPGYTDSLGNKLPSVTTVIGRFKDSGPLLWWANKAGLDGKSLEEARTPAASAGTMAHLLVEASLRGEPTPRLDGPPDTVAKAQAAFTVYRKWKDQTRLEIKHAEVALVSERFKFGGKLDAIGVLGNELCLCDWKSSASVYVDYTLQLAAYGLLWDENYPEHPLVGGFHLLRFAKEGGDFAHHHFPKLDDERAVFLQMRELYDGIKRCERRVK